MPTRNVCHVLWVAKAAAKIGASVEIEPSISPVRPGCTYCRTNDRRATCASISLCFARQLHIRNMLGNADMLAFGSNEIAKQLANFRIRRAL